MQTIYITDDEPSVLEILSAFLQRDGFAVENFGGGEALIAACARRCPDLVVLDIMMPGMDGLSACSALRRQYPRLPILLISSRDCLCDRSAGLPMAGVDFMRKPFLPLELAARIRALLGQSRGSAAAYPAAPK